MQIEAGKYYRTRHGRKAIVQAIVTDMLGVGAPHPKYVAYGQVADYWPIQRWTNDGKSGPGCMASTHYDYGKYEADSNCDLVAPWVDPPKKVQLEATVHADGLVEVDLTPLGDFNTRNLQIIVPNKICEIVTFDGMPCCDTPCCGK